MSAGAGGLNSRWRVCSPERQKETETESEKSPPPRGDGHATVLSPPFSSRDLGHTRTRAWREFRPPSLGLELQSTTWESSDIAIMLTAGPYFRDFLL